MYMWFQKLEDNNWNHVAWMFIFLCEWNIALLLFIWTETYIYNNMANSNIAYTFLSFEWLILLIRTYLSLSGLCKYMIINNLSK